VDDTDTGKGKSIAFPSSNDGDRLGQASLKLAEQEKQSRLLLSNPPVIDDGEAIDEAVRGRNWPVQESANLEPTEAPDDSRLKDSMTAVQIETLPTLTVVGDDRQTEDAEDPVNSSGTHQVCDRDPETEPPKKRPRKRVVREFIPRLKTSTGRITRATQRWAFLATVGDERWEPSSFTEAIRRSDAPQWRVGIEDEFQSHRDNKSFSEVELPIGAKALASGWVFKRKQVVNRRGLISEA